MKMLFEDIHGINLAEQWHPHLNHQLKIDDYTPRSRKKVWWRCRRGHDWKASINRRIKGQGCPYCSGEKKVVKGSIPRLNPDLVKEWHPEKNDELSPWDFSTGSSAKVWWKCEKGHEWEALIVSRARRGTRCPVCAGKLSPLENSLAFKRPDVARDWHPEKNGILTPDRVKVNSLRMVWWRCDQGHEWKNEVRAEARKFGCPVCPPLERLPYHQTLAYKSPEVARLWHPEKNRPLTPDKVRYGSLDLVWWKCPENHEWKAGILYQRKIKSCPYCSGRRAPYEMNIGFLYPETVSLWHPEKNGDLSPYYITEESNRKIWWRCDHGHEWQRIPKTQVKLKVCPYCDKK